MTNGLWQQLGLIALYTTHYLSIAVWVGVMLFNLIVNFPAIRSRTRTPSDYVAAMSAQSKRAGPWLYILIALTLLSGWALATIHGGATSGRYGDAMLAKSALLALMLAFHLWGSFGLWPKIHFAVETEWPKLMLQYQLSIAFSSVFGIAAILLTYALRVFPAT
jgi:putative copper export protein